MLWRRFGREYLKQLEVKSIDRTFEYMDKELIQYIDATDNMQLEYLESKIVPDFIKLCNPEWNENVDENEAFINALRLADEFWNIYIKHAIAEVEAIEIILKSSDECKECYLVFNVEMPYRKAIKYINNNKVKYIIFKSSREGYDIRILRDSCKFKDEISHEADINIAKQIIGIDDLIYVDVNGKLCCTKTLESAIKIAKYNEKIGPKAMTELLHQASKENNLEDEFIIHLNKVEEYEREYLEEILDIMCYCLQNGIPVPGDENTKRNFTIIDYYSLTSYPLEKLKLRAVTLNLLSNNNDRKLFMTFVTQNSQKGNYVLNVSLQSILDDLEITKQFGSTYRKLTSDEKIAIYYLLKERKMPMTFENFNVAVSEYAHNRLFLARR